MNQLFYGENLEVLCLHIADESVDLVYLDPPFNSDANYNVLFAEHDGTNAASQMEAFEDTWQWDEGAARRLRAQTAGISNGTKSGTIGPFRRKCGRIG